MDSRSSRRPPRRRRQSPHAGPQAHSRRAWRRAAFPDIREDPSEAGRRSLSNRPKSNARCHNAPPQARLSKGTDAPARTPRGALSTMPLPKLKDITWVTTDCYGTLIDWEKGIIDAFKKEADRDGLSFDEQQLIDRFLEVQAEVMAGSYELYAEVLRRTAVKVAGEIGWELEPSRAQFLPDSVGHWMPFREANAAMDRLAKRYPQI